MAPPLIRGLYILKREQGELKIAKGCALEIRGRG
jgi:hypothetical protein